MPRRTDERQEGLVDHGEDLGAEAPLIYVAMPLSQVPEEHRETIELLAFAVNETILQQTRNEIEPWPVRVHSPIKHSAPWKEDGRTRVTSEGIESISEIPWPPPSGVEWCGTPRPPRRRASVRSAIWVSADQWTVGR
jgi:hypothetical protein